jgi:hypothetical protein
MLRIFYVLCAFIHDAASVQMDVIRDKPRVAIMLVGRSMNSRVMTRSTNIAHAPLQTRGVGAGTSNATNIVDFMTGEEYNDAGTQDFETRYDVSDSIWDNIVKMLIDRVKETHEVDVVVCIDRAVGQVPAEVSHVFELNARTQEERGHKCLTELKHQNRRYEWLIKTRPDFMFYKPFPVMSSFHPGYVYTRFRFAGGISGLTSDHFSYDYCTPECNANPPGHHGYMNDDMVRVVPASLMDFAFYTDDDIDDEASKTHETPDTWITFPFRTHEAGLATFWLDRGILTMPLACPGYPRHGEGHHHHHQLSLTCATKPVKKKCVPDIPIERVHTTLVQK